VKASRYLTHVRRLTDLDRGIRRFYAPLAPLVQAGRRGPVLWQLPETFARDDERLTRWRDALPMGVTRSSFAIRAGSAGPCSTCCAAAGSRLTVGDHPDRPFQQRVATADRWYVRLHYGSRS
jgi:uncharacterized protein YecE (DUF72 family)